MGVNGGLMKLVSWWPKKGTAFEEWLQRRDWDACNRYWAQTAVVKQAVTVVIRMADCRWGEQLGNDFDGNRKRVRKKQK